MLLAKSLFLDREYARNQVLRGSNIAFLECVASLCRKLLNALAQCWIQLDDYQCREDERKIRS